MIGNEKTGQRSVFFTYTILILDVNDTISITKYYKENCHMKYKEITDYSYQRL